MIGELGCGGIMIGVGVVVGVMVDISRRWICIATVVALRYGGSSVRVGVGSVVRCWRGGVVETHVLLWCLPDLVLNFKISKYFSTSSTYDGLVNAHNSAFTNIHTRPHICECRNICIHKSTYCGHMCECRNTCIHATKYL